MPTTITQGFAKLKSNLEITDLQAGTASTRQSNIRDAIAEQMAVLDSFLTGSYRRSTMIAPLSSADIDIAVVLDPKYYKADGQANLLDQVKRVLKKRYPTTPDISRNGQAVTIVFTDFQVDVVPAFYRDGGGYLIPDSIRKRWIATNPKRHVELWADANKAHDGDLIPLIKMMKAWNREHSKLLRSFHLETLVLQTLNNVTISDFPSGARYVLNKMQGRLGKSVSDPAGYGGDVGDYLDTEDKVEAVASRVQTAYDRAVSAEQLEQNGRTEEAFKKWRMIFGDAFPAYR